MVENHEVVISVLMPVYNGEKYLREAIESILIQSFREFELLILLEYGSSDLSREIVYSYEDTRIRVIENESKLGLPLSLNRGIEEAKGKYIARMDSDDISYKKRLKAEYNYLERHPDVSLVGSAGRINGKNKIFSGMKKIEDIRLFSFFGCPFVHPTVMWRKSDFEKKGLRYNDLDEAEDYDLWIRVIGQLKAANISAPLLYYRVYGDNKSARGNYQLKQQNEQLLMNYWNSNEMRYYSEEGYLSEVSMSKECRQYLFRCSELISNQVLTKKFFIYLKNEIISHILNEVIEEKQVNEVIDKLGLDKTNFFKIKRWFIKYRIFRRKVRLAFER